MIGWPSEATADTLERCLIRAVRSGDMTAGRAGLTGVARVHEQHRHAPQAGFVGDERLQLPEAPVMQSCPLAPLCLNPTAYALEIFQGNRAAGAFGVGNDSFTEAVVRIRLKPCLPPADGTELTGRGTGLFALQVPASVGEAAAVGFNFFAAIDRTRTGRSQVHDAQVNAQYVQGLDGFRFFHVADAGDVPLAANIEQVHFALAGLQELPLVLSADVGDSLPTAKGPDTDLSVTAKAKDPVVIRLTCMFAEGALRLAVQLIGIGDLRYTPDSSLGSQPKLSTHGGVGQLLQGKLAESPGLPRLLRDPIACGITAFQRLFQQGRLLGSRQQLNVGHQLHGFKYRENALLVQGRFIPTAQARGFRACAQAERKFW